MGKLVIIDVDPVSLEASIEKRKSLEMDVRVEKILLEMGLKKLKPIPEIKVAKKIKYTNSTGPK